MFNMTIESQMTVGNKTIIGGRTQYDLIPKTVIIDGKETVVLGVPYGIKPPFFAVEIAKTDINLIGKQIVA